MRWLLLANKTSLSDVLLFQTSGNTDLMVNIQVIAFPTQLYNGLWGTTYWRIIPLFNIANNASSHYSWKEISAITFLYPVFVEMAGHNGLYLNKQKEAFREGLSCAVLQKQLFGECQGKKRTGKSPLWASFACAFWKQSNGVYIWSLSKYTKVYHNIQYRYWKKWLTKP